MIAKIPSTPEQIETQECLRLGSFDEVPKGPEDTKFIIPTRAPIKDEKNLKFK